MSAQMKRQRTARLMKTLSRAYYHHKRGEEKLVHQIIVEDFVSFGGVYVKFLQGVLLQSRILKNANIEDRLKVFETLDPEPVDILEHLQRELPPHKLSRIKAIGRLPFAAGSFGQVYMGELDTGQRIIIKLLRPHIRETLTFDLRILSSFARATTGWFMKNIEADYTSAIQDFKRATLGETDYVAEAHFAHQMYTYYKDHPDFIVPETFLDLCTANIIVQEFVDGISGAELIKIKEKQGIEPATYIKQTLQSDLALQLEMFGYEFLYGVFSHGLIQGDPHPGNVKFLSGNRVGLIDFGISAHAPRDKFGLLELIKQYQKILDGAPDVTELYAQFMRFFVADLYKALKTLGKLRTSATDEDLTNIIGSVAGKAFETEIGQDSEKVKAMVKDGSLLTMINRTMNKGNRFGFVVQLQAGDMLRAARTYIALLGSLNLRNEVMPIVFEKVAADVQTNAHELGINADSEAAISMDTAVQTIASWLERVAERDPALLSQLMKKIYANELPGISPTVQDTKEKVE